MSRFMLDTNVLSDIGNERAGWQCIVGKIAPDGTAHARKANQLT